ncbi:MAG: hypothetical protein A2252_04620 [Elusimicrobia bacterium RIFOXYA2_FULL_39_19]|nr:MAG: hypothetical protein A2252_04620 [Elusimicrobia bacterium RIFOXYA2_FULL_39_19]
MSRIISICNQKGGVGKTTTAINLASGLAYLTKSVLLIDLDSQSNATSGLGLNKDEIEFSAYDVLVDEKRPQDGILQTSIEFLDLLPSNVDLVGTEVELVNMSNRENRLKEALATITNSYDYIFIDCPPSLGLLTINALTASDSVLIPIQCEYYAMEGLTQLMKTIHLVRSSLNPQLQLEGVLMTMFDQRANLSNQVVAEVKKFFGKKAYKTIIPRNVRVAEAPSHGKPVFFYDASSRGSLAYLDFAKEFLNIAD